MPKADQTVIDSVEAYQDALEVCTSQREQIKEDLAFSDPSNPRQWDEEEKNARERDPGGARPCLVFDLVGQYIANVAGQVESRPPSLHVIPVDSGADIKVAEQLDGVFRSIEYASRAQQHYARAMTSAARAGVGYLIVRPEITDAALRYQMPMISSEGDPLRVLLDPWSVELDGSDADFGYVLTPMSHKQFERKYGKDAQKASFGDDDSSADERDSIVVAEEWRTEEKTRLVITYTDERGIDQSLPEEDFAIAMQNGQQLQATGQYKDKYRCVKWRRLSGAEVLEAEREYPSSHIGIVPVYGYVGYSDSRMSYCGLPRRARSAQQTYNRSVSDIRAYMENAPRSPWVASVRAVRGFESLWERASVEARGFLPYNDVDDQGAPIAPPQRMQPSINLNNLMASAESAKMDIQSCIGMYAANLGQASNETSGVAIESRKQQGEASTAHFPSHLAASLGQVGRICLDMIPRLIDTKRQLTIMGLDAKPGTVMVDPEQPEAMAETERGVVINPSVGTYDVRIVVGASFSTQRSQAQEAYTEMMRANPSIMPVIAPLWAQTLDVPHADKLAQVLTAVAPPEVKEILQPGGSGETKEQLKSKLQESSKALEEATRLAKEAQADADQAHAKLAEQAEEMAQKDDEVSIKAYEALTNRLKVTSVMMRPEDVQAIARDTVMAMLSQSAPMDEPEAAQEVPEAQESFPAQAMEAPTESFAPEAMPSGDFSQEGGPPSDSQPEEPAPPGEFQ